MLVFVCLHRLHEVCAGSKFVGTAGSGHASGAVVDDLDSYTGTFDKRVREAWDKRLRRSESITALWAMH